MSEGPDDTDFWSLRPRTRTPLSDVEEQGLRQRKKALMRQLISDTATHMFLKSGFDEVRVSEIAAACDVSEKTVYNYFPTKESLLFDREEDSIEAIRQALGPEGPRSSPVEAIVKVLSDELDHFVAYHAATKGSSLPAFFEFNELIERTPALRAYRSDSIERIAQVAAQAMAARADLNPEDPEPQIAADALVGLWRVFYRSMLKWSAQPISPVELREAVLADIRRAARLIETGLWSFSTVVQGASGRAQIQAAADASNEARKQVLLALKQARDAWKTLKVDVEARVREETGSPRVAARHVAHQMAAQEAHELRRQMLQERQEIKQEVKEAIKRARRKRPGV